MLPAKLSARTQAAAAFAEHNAEGAHRSKERVWRVACQVIHTLQGTIALPRPHCSLAPQVFRMLLGEMRKLGATIVFADFSRIIVCTGKHSLDSALGYVDSLAATVKAKDLFQWIDLTPARSWHSLLFMDEYNFGGLLQVTVSGYQQRLDRRII